MTHRSLTLLFLLASAGLGLAPAKAADLPAVPDGPPTKALDVPLSLGTNTVTGRNLGEAFIQFLEQPDVQNSLLRSITNRIFDSKHTNALFGFINDLHLQPKILKATGPGDDDAVLGFSYDFSKSVANRVYNESGRNPIGVSFNLEAKGTVAFEASKNPENFLESKGSFQLFQGLGGISPNLKGGQEWFEARNAATTAAGEIPDSPNWKDDPRWQDSIRPLGDIIIPQFFYDARAHGGVESDQQFKNLQYVYGGQVGIVYRDWRDTGWVRWLNVLDYPFALIRSLSYNTDISPSGRAIPALIGGIDQVDPTENEARLAIDPSTDPFARVRFEVAFKTQVLRAFGKDLWFSANYRYYQELGASRLIRDAGMEKHEYFVFHMDLPYHFGVSYSTGKLPLDAENDQIYALGWSLEF